MLRFTPADFSEINQLADLLFDPTESTIELHSEHKLATQAWINGALYHSDLAQRCSATQIEATKSAWIFSDTGKLTRAEISSSKKTTTLSLPALSAEQRASLLHYYCSNTLHTHLFTIPLSTLQKALEWQARYCIDHDIVSRTIDLLRRATTRFLLTHADEQQATILEPRHVAQVLADWQRVNVSDLLRATDDTLELKIFLNEHIVGQSFAIEHFLQTRNTHNLFLLAGPVYSGKKTFVENLAQFTHGAKHWYFTLNLSFFASDIALSDIFVTSHAQPQNYARLIHVLEEYPQAMIVLTQAHENPELLSRLQRDMHRQFFQLNERCISIARTTWMILFDTEAPEPLSSVVQESIFPEHSPIDLADILYRPSLSPMATSNEEEQFAEDYPLKSVKKYFSTDVLAQASLLTFLPLSEKSKKIILNKEIKRIVQLLREKHSVALYYQEEIMHFLLNRVNKENQGFDDVHQNLYIQIENIVLKSLEKGDVIDEEILMLQLNDTGQILQVVRTNTKAGATQAKLRI